MGVLYTKSEDSSLDAAMERVLAEGPLTIIRSGKPSMVMLSAEDFRRLGGEGVNETPEPGLVACLLRRPLEEGVDLDALIGDRHQPATRPAVDFGDGA